MNTRELTTEQLDEYKKDINICPFCKSDDTASNQMEVDGTAAWQECSCQACGKEWTDEYELNLLNVTYRHGSWRDLVEGS